MTFFKLAFRPDKTFLYEYKIYQKKQKCNTWEGLISNFLYFLPYVWRKSGFNIFQVPGISDQGPDIREQGSEDRDQGSGNREQGTGNREQGTGNREQGTEN